MSWSVGSSDFLNVGTTKAAPITSTPMATNAGIGVRTTGANTAAYTLLMPRVTGDSRRSGCRRDSRSPRAGATVVAVSSEATTASRAAPAIGG